MIKSVSDSDDGRYQCFRSVCKQVSDSMKCVGGEMKRKTDIHLFLFLPYTVTLREHTPNSYEQTNTPYMAKHNEDCHCTYAHDALYFGQKTNN